MTDKLKKIGLLLFALILSVLSSLSIIPYFDAVTNFINSANVPDNPTAFFMGGFFGAFFGVLFDFAFFVFCLILIFGSKEKLRLSLLLSKKGEPKRCTVIRILGYAIILLFAFIYISDVLRYSAFIPEELLFCVLSIAAVFLYLIILENILYSSAIHKRPGGARTAAAFTATMFIPVAMIISLVFYMNFASNNDMSKSEISNYVSNNTSELIECVNYFKENDTAFVRLGKYCSMSPDDEVFIKAQNQPEYLPAENEMIKELFKDGITSITVSDNYIDFGCGGRGMGPSTSYSGFYYTEGDIKDYDNMYNYEFQPYENGIRYQEPGGDNEIYLEPLAENFYYYNEKY